METLADVLKLIIHDWDYLAELTMEHIYMSVSGVLLAIVIGVPLAILMTRNKKLAAVIQTTINIIQTIPTLALLLLIMIFLGLGSGTAIVALVCYSFLPIIQNTYTGLQNVDESMIEAGVGMGMTNTQLLMKVKIPLALPIIMAGIRVATVVSIGVATIATFVGAGGLGELIYRGIVTTDDVKVLAGSIPAALLAIIVDALLGVIEKKSGVTLHKTRTQ